MIHGIHRRPLGVVTNCKHRKLLFVLSGILGSTFPSKSRILHNLLHIGTEEHVYRSLFGEHHSTSSSSNFFSFTRFIDLSPAQLSAMMLKGLVFRLLALVLLLKEISVLHHQRFWAQRDNTFLGPKGLLLWPDSTTAFPNVQSSSILQSLVFTGYTKRVSSHLTHNIQPILDDEDHKPLRGKNKELAKGTRPRRMSASAVSPTSPTKKKESHRKGSHSHTVISPTGKLPTSPLKHSPTGPFSPTKHYGHTFSPQLSPNRPHHSLQLSPSSLHQHPQGPHPGDFHNPSFHHSSSQGFMALHSPPGHSRASLHSPTGNVPSSFHSPPGHVPFFSSSSSSLLVSLPEEFQAYPTTTAFPIDRTLQATALPSFLSTYVPKVRTI